MYNGLLNIYKEKDFTSHDVVAKLRGILRQKKIGHTGTLDPNAEGVLPVCLGKGTKLCDMLTGTKKQYKVSFVFEKETDTEDIWGTVTKTHEPLKQDAPIKDTILSFVGEYDQVPPMYSAKKINGKKLYELAREGKIIERKPERIRIYDISDIEISYPEVTMTVTCSKGTYIRSLCRDIGHKLQNGACMTKLVRTRSSGFQLEYAHTLSEIEAMKPESLTVHSLAIKRAAALNIWRDKYKQLSTNNTDEIIRMTEDTAKRLSMEPYYMYRQKNMAGNVENVGYSVEGLECIYNILIMEEKQTIIACGAGASSKVVFHNEADDNHSVRIERIENVKDVRNYIQRIDEMIDRKKKFFEENNF